MSAVRIATCQCAGLSIACEGDPRFVAMCHCEHCQRRTGSSYNLGAWFDRTAVRAAGRGRIYTRVGDDTGAEIQFHFCPTCGTSVYWEMPDGSLPDMMAVAVGCFADPDFPGPTLSVYGKSRHHWLSIPGGIPCFTESTESEPE